MIVYEECLLKEIQYMIIRKLMDGDGFGMSALSNESDFEDG